MLDTLLFLCSHIVCAALWAATRFLLGALTGTAANFSSFAAMYRPVGERFL